MNAGSNQVSDFAVLPGGTLRLRNVVASGGTEPTSVAINGGLAEVLNAGGMPTWPGSGRPGAADSIDTFAVGRGETLAPAVTSPSDSPLSFAEVLTPSSQLLVADDGAAGTSAVSPYQIAPDGTLHATPAAVPDGETAACWISRAWNGDVFVDNAGSGTVASYRLSPGGQLTSLRNTSAGTGAVPLDNAVSSDGHGLYVLDRGNGELAS